MEVVFFNWQSMLRELGPIVAVIFFFIWRDWRREASLSSRIERLEDYQKETLVQLVEKGTAALVQSSEVIKWIGRVMERATTRCPYIESPPQEMPCISDQNNG